MCTSVTNGLNGDRAAAVAHLRVDRAKRTLKVLRLRLAECNGYIVRTYYYRLGLMLQPNALKHSGRSRDSVRCAVCYALR